LNSLSKVVKIILNIDFTSLWSEVFFIFDAGNKADEHGRFQTKVQEKEYQLKMLMILNKEMTKAQNFFIPGATNK
jgi:hypothetical protein